MPCLPKETFKSKLLLEDKTMAEKKNPHKIIRGVPSWYTKTFVRIWPRRNCTFWQCAFGYNHRTRNPAGVGYLKYTSLFTCLLRWSFLLFHRIGIMSLGWTKLTNVSMILQKQGQLPTAVLWKVLCVCYAVIILADHLGKGNLIHLDIIFKIPEFSSSKRDTSLTPNLTSDIWGVLETRGFLCVSFLYFGSN